MQILNIKTKAVKDLISNNRLQNWVLIFILFPALLSLSLLSPQLWFGKTIRIPKECENFPVYNPPNPTSFFLLSEFTKYFYGTPLTLKSINVCLQNANQILNEEVQVLLPSKKDPEAGAMQIAMTYHDGSTQSLYVPVNSEKCSEFPLKVIDKVELSFRGYNSPDIKTFIISDNSFIKYLPNYYELMAKIIIIFLGWMVFIVNLSASVELVKKIKTNRNFNKN